MEAFLPPSGWRVSMTEVSGRALSVISSRRPKKPGEFGEIGLVLGFATSQREDCLFKQYCTWPPRRRSKPLHFASTAGRETRLNNSCSSDVTRHYAANAQDIADSGFGKLDSLLNRLFYRIARAPLSIPFTAKHY